MEVSKKEFEKILRTQIYKSCVNMLMCFGLFSILIDFLESACELIGISQHWRMCVTIPILIYTIYWVNKE